MSGASYLLAGPRSAPGRSISLRRARERSTREGVAVNASQLGDFTARAIWFCIVAGVTFLVTNSLIIAVLAGAVYVILFGRGDPTA